MRLCTRGYLVLQFLERAKPSGFDLKNVRISIAPQRESCIRKFCFQKVVVIPVPRCRLESKEQLKQVLNKDSIAILFHIPVCRRAPATNSSRTTVKQLAAHDGPTLIRRNQVIIVGGRE